MNLKIRMKNGTIKRNNKKLNLQLINIVCKEGKMDSKKDHLRQKKDLLF